MSVNDFLFNVGRKERQQEWEGNFREYFEMATRRPEITQLAIQRLYTMIISKGTTKKEDGTVIYNFFNGKIMGAEKQIEDIMMYLKAASMGLDIKKRVLLLLGPPGGGKSMILGLLKKELSKYTKTDNGAIFAIDGCPINEEPMHLIPENDRDAIWRDHKIKIEGKLCPVCQFKFETDWNRNLNNVPVKRIYISEENRIGIGTFAPAEKNNMEELYGSADLSKLDYYGNSGDVRAYAFNGELHTANRGIMEFIEILKAKSEFLHTLLTLAEEQQFKTPRFPLQYVDEALISHTNEGEFLRFISNRENEAVVDRLYIVRMPYNMDVEHEEMIYHYALKTKLVVKDVEVHPGAVRLASTFAIKTRENEDPLRSGMSGISPRFILNTLAIAMVKVGKKNVEPIDMLKILKSQVYNYPILDLETRKKYLSFLDELEDNISTFNKTSKPNNPFKKEDIGIYDLVIGDE